MESGENGKEIIAINLLLQQYDYIEQYPSYLDTKQEQAQRIKKFSMLGSKNPTGLPVRVVSWKKNLLILFINVIM